MAQQEQDKREKKLSHEMVYGISSQKKLGLTINSRNSSNFHERHSRSSENGAHLTAYSLIHMKFATYILSLFFFSQIATAAFYEEPFDEGGRNSQYYTDATQEILRQVRNAKAQKAKAHTYYVKPGKKNVHAYSSARSAAIRLDNENTREEKKIERTFKEGQKVSLIPLDCGIGVIKRKKQPSTLFVIMRHFESENERNERIAAENAPVTKEIQIGTAEIVAEKVLLYSFSSDCKKAEQYAKVGDEEFEQWILYVLRKDRGTLVSKGEKVMIMEIDGTYVKVLYKNDEWWMNGNTLKMK